MNEADKILSQPIVEIAGAALTIGATLRAVLILFAAFVIAWLVRRLTRRFQDRLGEENASTVYIGGQVVRYLVVFAGLAVAISALGVDLSALSLFAGALGVGIGLGLQDVVKNFVCGIILLFDRGIEVGDFIELEDGTNGAVVAIGARATSLITNDNVAVLVPNATLLNGKLTNWTRNRATRRIHVPFSVALGSDKDVVKQAALEAAGSVAFTLPEEGRQKTQVWLVGFGEGALQFELVVWPSLEAVKRPGSMMAAYCWALDDALRKYGLEIPLPQRELRLRGFFGREGEAARQAWTGQQEDALAQALAGGNGPASTQGGIGASGNDAAGDIDAAAEGPGPRAGVSEALLKGAQ